MTTAPARRTARPGADAPTRTIALIGAILCLGVVYIHLADQGGYLPSEWFPGEKDPEYIKIGYYLLEAVGVLAAVLLVVQARTSGWFLALGVAAGPLIAFVLTRSVGLPDATDDKGNWGEPLGVASLIVEGLLLLLALSQLPRRKV